MAEEYTPTEAQVRDYYALMAASPAKAYEEGLRDFDRFLATARRAAAEKAWDEGAQAGLDTGLTIAESVHANGGVLDLADVPHAPANPYREEADRG